MGNEWEVYAWEAINKDRDEFDYVLKYEGNSREEAMKVADALAVLKCGCIKIEWRPLL